MIRIPELPYGLSLTRLALLIIGVVYLISGLGSTSYWVLKAMKGPQEEVFVPFGLSTTRALNYMFADFLLILCCFSAAYYCILRKSGLGSRIGGIAFVLQGLLGFYVDRSNLTREQFGVEAAELQPIFLNFWFVGFGGLSIWVDYYGLTFLSRFQPQTTL